MKRTTSLRLIGRFTRTAPPNWSKVGGCRFTTIAFRGKETQDSQKEHRGIQIELKLVSIIRDKKPSIAVKRYPLDLLQHWTREDRPVPPFFAHRRMCRRCCTKGAAPCRNVAANPRSSVPTAERNAPPAAAARSAGSPRSR